jgi:SAM-dependent methyltransferase
MNKPGGEKPEYGNWVPPRFVYIPGLTGLLFLGLSYAYLPLIGVAVFCLLISGYLAYARYRFSPAGGDLQAKIREGVLSHLDWDGKGKALDVGCGNGALVVRLAQKYSEAKVTGIDYWGAMWEYSKGVCERNAKLEGVAQRVIFQNASGSALPFKDGSFDVVISNLAFHEVRDVKDKREVIREALRVVKKRGRFVFQDLFLLRRIYGQIDDLVAAVKSMGITRVEFVRTGNAAFIPKVLKLPDMVGALGILYGEKG